jgi:hypothetical protein
MPYLILRDVTCNVMHGYCHRHYTYHILILTIITCKVMYGYCHRHYTSYIFILTDVTCMDTTRGVTCDVRDA